MPVFYWFRFEGHLDFSIPDSDLLDSSPTCDMSAIGDHMAAIPHLSDSWDNIMAAVGAMYKAEMGLDEVLREFDGLGSSVKDGASKLSIEKLGARISLALKKVLIV